MGPDTASHAIRFGQVVVRSIRVELGHDVDGSCIHQMSDGRIFPVSGEKGVDGAEADLGAHHLTGMQVSVEPIARFFLALSRLLVGNGDHEEILTQIALPDGVQPCKFRVGLDHAVQVFDNILKCVVMVEFQFRGLCICSPGISDENRHQN